VKGATVAKFNLKKPSQILTTPTVLRVLFNLCRRPPIRLGMRQDRRGGRFRDPRFASFMLETNRKPLDTDIHDTVLKGRKMMKNCFRLALVAGGAWVAIESAKALSVF
jgi:hypothetical protein